MALTHDHLLRERFRDGILWAGLGHEGIKLAHTLENRNRLTFLLANLGSAREHQGDYPQANRYFEENLAFARTIGAPRYIYTVLLDRGEIHLKYQQLDAARAAFHEVLLQEKSPDRELELAANALYGLARIAHAQGQIADAIRLAQESEAAFTAIEHHKATKVREWRQSLYLSIPYSKTEFSDAISIQARAQRYLMVRFSSSYLVAISTATCYTRVSDRLNFMLQRSSINSYPHLFLFLHYLHR